MTTVLGIDVSGYQDPERVNYAELKAHGFGFVVVKLDQYLTEEHVTLARAAGLEVGGYWWNDPNDAPSYQAGRVLAEVKRLGLRFAALDVEQFWSDWDAYWRYLRKEIALAELPKFAPANISANAQIVMALVKESITVPWLVYTAEWFIQGWAAPIANWIGNYQSWVAQYLHSGANEHMTWEALKALPGSSSLRPLAGSTPKIWQVSGSFIYPGRSQWDVYDTDLFLGGPNDLAAWLKFPAPVPGFIPYKVVAFAYPCLLIRNAPVTGAVVGRLYLNQPAVTILEEAIDSKGGKWGRITAGWISLAWTKKV
jgi:GH25 family lysozyme M1 (1,4-beta-N-acetylmuramidase)